MSKNSSKQYTVSFDTDFSLEYKVSKGTANSDYHIHNSYEILLCLSDNMFCRTDTGNYDIGAGTLLLFNCSDLHYFGPKEPDGDNIRYVLCFKPGFLDFLATDIPEMMNCFFSRPDGCGHALNLNAEQLEHVKELMDRMLELQHAGKKIPNGSLKIKLCFAQLLVDINDYYMDRYELSGPSDSGDRSLVYSIMDYIYSNYAEDLSLESIAKAFFVNKYTLSESFKNITGLTPNRFIINYRIQKAKSFLLSGDSVEIACAKCGYNNLAHFSRIFKDRVGMSPKQFQIKMKNQNREDT